MNSDTVLGYFERVHDQVAFGWAYSRVDPEKRITVHILDGDEIIGRGVADTAREDLVSAGIGDGHYAFSIPLSKAIQDGRRHTLIAADSASRLALNGSHEVFTQRVKHSFPAISRSEARNALLQHVTRSESAATVNHHDVLTAYTLSSLLQETNLQELARSGYRAIAASVGSNAVCSCKVAETFLLEKDYRGALSNYQEASAADPSFHWAALGTGYALECLGRRDEALAAYLEAASLDDRHESKVRALAIRLGCTRDNSSGPYCYDQSDRDLILEALVDPTLTLDAEDLLRQLYRSASNEQNNVEETCSAALELGIESRTLEAILARYYPQSIPGGST